MSFDEARRYLLERARAAGIEVEVLASETRELTIESYEGRPADLTQASKGGVGVRAVLEGRTGYAFTEELTAAALDWVLAEARENALLQVDEGAFLPDNPALGRKDLLSEGLSAPLGEKVERALTLERELQSDPRTRRVVMARYSERETSESLSSTRGADAGFRNGLSALMASFVMQQGESVKQGWDADVSKEFHGLDPAATAQHMLEGTGRLLGARDLPTGRYRAYLEPRVVSQLLALLAFALSGKTLLEGKSRFAGRLGEQVASDLLTLIDDPTLADGVASRPFDSEGTPTRPVTLIENGRLVSFLHNSHTARRAGHENTAHAERSYRGTLGVGVTNLFIPPGLGVKQEDGVVVAEVMGVHAGANPVTGDLSLQGLGLRVVGGESHPVENFALSGNLFEMLRRVSALGERLEWSPHGIGAPLVAIEDVSFAGS